MIPNQKNIIKNIAVFGSVQVFSMAIGVLRSKFAAVLLGTHGVGFLGLISSAFGLITSALNLGLPTSLVKYLSVSSEETLPKKLKITQILTWLLGIFGAFICIIFAKPISYFTFGNTNYTWAFILLSFSVLFKLGTIGYSSILQSRNHLKKLANANLLANFLGILFTIPLYYFFRINGVVYNLIAVGLVEILVVIYFFKTLKIREEKINKQEFLKESKIIIGDGFYYNLSGFSAILSAYLVQIYVSRFGGIDTLGLYVTGTTILNTYVSIIFTAMGYDYFPRISKVAENTEKLNTEVNHQLKVGIILLFPILLWLIIFCPLVVKILFSKAFLGSVIFVEIAVLGVFFKLFSWLLAFTFIAKSQKKLFLYNEIIFGILYVLINILGFYTGQLRGLGIGYSVYFFSYLAVVYIIATRKLNITVFHKNLVIYLLCCGIILVEILINIFISANNLRLFLMIFVAIFASLWSLKQFKEIYGFKNS